MIPNKNQNTYAGFINGYIAGNLSANSKELYFHKDKIFSFLNELRRDILKWQIDPTVKNSLEEFLSKNEVSNYENSLDYYLNLGDLLLSIFSLISDTKNNNLPLPSTINFNLKKILYHYLNIATALKDRKVTKKAKEIVAKFETSAS